MASSVVDPQNQAVVPPTFYGRHLTIALLITLFDVESESTVFEATISVSKVSRSDFLCCLTMGDSSVPSNKRKS